MFTGNLTQSRTPKSNMTISKSSDVGMIILSESFRLISINPAACRMLGILPQSGKVYQPEKLFYADSLGTAYELLNKVVNTGNTLSDIDLNLVNQKGSQIPCRLCASPLAAGEKEVSGIIISFTRVSDKNPVSNQDKRRNKTEYSQLSFLPRISYNHILDGLPEGVFTIDTDWRIRTFNTQLEKLSGFKKEDIIGKFCWQVFQSGKCKHDCPFNEIFNEKISCENQEMTIINHNGSVKKIMVSTAPLKDESGDITGGIGSFSMPPVRSGKKIPFQIVESFEGMVGKSRSMKMIFDKLPDIAQSSASVLITGESGTGKELIASAIHKLSKKPQNTFQAVNCSAFSAYSWPGNIRELERVMEYAFVFVKGPIIFSRYMPAECEFEGGTSLRQSGAGISEKEKLLQALNKADYKRTKAASLLGISRSSLWRKMKNYGLLDQ